MEAVSGGATAEKIQDLKDSMGRQPIDRKRGPVEGGTLKLLARGDRRTHGGN